MLKNLTAILSLALNLGLLVIELEFILILYCRLRQQHRRRKKDGRPGGRAPMREAWQKDLTDEMYDDVPQQDLESASEEHSFSKADGNQAAGAKREAESKDKIKEVLDSARTESPVLEAAEKEAAVRSDSERDGRPSGGLLPSAGMEAKQTVKPAPPAIKPTHNRPFIRLGLERDRGLNSYSHPPDIIEKDDGELQILKQADSLYLVVPSEKILTESRLNFSAVVQCFKVAVDNEDGKKFRVTVVEPAILTKQDGVYKVAHVGKLTAEGM